MWRLFILGTAKILPGKSQALKTTAYITTKDQLTYIEYNPLILQHFQ